MEIIYNADTIKSVVAALNRLQITGVENAGILTFIIQELSKHKTIEPEDDGDDK